MNFESMELKTFSLSFPIISLITVSLHRVKYESVFHIGELKLINTYLQNPPFIFIFLDNAHKYPKLYDN